MLAVRLLGMPITELEQSVQAELDDNPAMESAAPEDAFGDNLGQDSTLTASAAGEDRQAAEGDSDFADDDDYTAQTEKEERETALDDALERIGSDDRMPDIGERGFGAGTADADYEEMVYGGQTSFYDSLKEQMMDVELSETQREIMEYIIGSLDGDGLLRKSSTGICDELAVYHNIDCTEEEVESLISTLQQFDPAGIGAANLRECLLLQIDRRKPSRVTDMMREVISRCFDDFMSKHWERITRQTGMGDALAESVREELLKLNPKPGAALGETEGRSMQQITPDFVVDTADDGTVSFAINNGRLPELYVSPSFTELIEGYRQNRSSMTKRDKEALLYAKEKVERARGYIEAVRQRQHTLYITMKAIIELQKPFFRDGDESELRPMILKDVADRTGLDISTVSRVSNQKYAQTRWGTFRLRHFFSDGITAENGEEMSTRKVKMAMKEIISAEDKGKPLSDDALTKILKSKGYPVARRTVAKYREQLAIPVARLRRR